LKAGHEGHEGKHELFVGQLVERSMTRRTMILGLLMLAASATSGWAQAMRNVPRISIDELKTLMDRKNVVIIDVRDPSSFEAGHVPGALNIDYVNMPERAREFAKETRPIVTYCACTNETTAARAALDLIQAGSTNVKALAGGWNDWIRRGEAIEKKN
jgi:rhodanese-related sulfurtransferase